jgi:hypothetical protein
MFAATKVMPAGWESLSIDGAAEAREEAGSGSG